ncbi:hypothetical protein AAZV13_11G174500 [Glycine max]
MDSITYRDNKPSIPKHTHNNRVRINITENNVEMEANSGASEPNSNATIITINVKFGGVSIPISISPHLTINGFKSLLLPSTNVLPRGQKLIFKGKVLEDPMTLKTYKLTNDATDGPVWKKAQVVPKSRKDDSGSNNDMKKIPVKNRMERWKATGVVALSECNLEVIPDEVWVCGSSARVLDCNNNSITDVPDEIARLTGLDKLFINANEIVDKSIRWEGLTTLKYLTVLSLNHNNLTTLSSTLGSLTSLRELHVSNNKLSGLPNEIRHLTQLEVLRANNNRYYLNLQDIKEFVQSCLICQQAKHDTALPSGLLEPLPIPDQIWEDALYLGNTRMKSLPSKLFKTCLQLSTLDLHNTKITIDLLRRFEGWDNFDECQRSKHQKQIDFRVGVSRDFDEGVDKN